MESATAPVPKAPIDHMTEFFRMKGLTPPWRQTQPARETQEANENVPKPVNVGLRNLDFTRLAKPKFSTGDAEITKPRYKIHR